MTITRVLVVDDSATMRTLIKACLRRDPMIDVVGDAANADEARRQMRALEPDVVTLDVEMPGMSGLEFLEKVMTHRPTPVIMVSTLTHAGADAAIEAMRRGAFDCVGKPQNGDYAAAFSDLADKVKAAAAAPVRGQRARSTKTVPHSAFTPSDKIVFIGASTGGVEAIFDVLSSFPANCPPTMITQHMPPLFTESFATRLNRACAPEVVQAKSGDTVKAGRVYIAPGGQAPLEVEGRSKPNCRLSANPPVNGHRPSVDILFRSAARLGRRGVGVLLTGMGRDGAEGLLAMRNAGAHTIAQDEATSVVYGMPAAAKSLGAACETAPLDKIASLILERCAAPAAKAAANG